MIKYPGDDIDFAVDFEKLENETVDGFSFFENVIVYLFTDACFVSKFSLVPKTGYNQLVLISETEINGVCPSIDTKKMEGNLKVEVMCILPSSIPDGKKNMTKSADTGIKIAKTLIKTEA